MENRRRLAAWFDLAPERLVNARQIHSNAVHTVTEPWAPGEGPKLDALVTDRPNLILAAASADCGPLLFVDEVAGVIGAAHAGWKGAFTGVMEATAEAMEALGARRGDIRVALGPTISGEAYEVGPEFRERFIAQAKENEAYFAPSSQTGHHMFDLPAYLAARAERAGLAFESLARCTYSEPDLFYSYRRTVHQGEADYGRLFSAIALKG